MATAILRATLTESKSEAVYGSKLADCIQRYLDSRTSDIGVRAQEQYRLVLSKLQTFASGHSRFFIEELTVDLCEDFLTYGFDGLKDTSKATSTAKFKHFLRDAFRRGWIREAIAEKLKPRKAVYDQKTPYSDKELACILATAEKLNGGTSGYATNGASFRLLLELMLTTGLRVSDAVRFDPSRCQKSKLWIYAFMPRKTRKNEKPKPVEVFLPESLFPRAAGRDVHSGRPRKADDKRPAAGFRPARASAGVSRQHSATSCRS